MTTHHHTRTQHAASAALALVLLPVGHKALRIATDSPLPTAGGYALAWTAFAIAWTLQRRHPGAIWLALTWITLLTAVTDTAVVHNTITELTGANW